MALTSSSTETDALAQLNNNLRYWESAAAAKDRLEALLWLQGNRPRLSADAQTQIQFLDLKAEIAEVRRLVDTDSSSSQARFTRGRPL